MSQPMNLSGPFIIGRLVDWAERFPCMKLLTNPKLADDIYTYHNLSTKGPINNNISLRDKEKAAE